MKVLSVNVSKIKTITINGQAVRTGIYKSATEEIVHLNKLNLIGDEQADKEVHGGLWKAVYVYPHEHYSKWKYKFPNLKLNYGAFGENITSEGLLENDIFVGDILQIGSSILSVSEPRQPCFKLNYKLNESKAGKFMLENFITGFYLKVVEEGNLRTDSEIKILKRGFGEVSITDLTNFLVFNIITNSKLQSLLDTDAVPSSIKTKIKSCF